MKSGLKSVGIFITGITVLSTRAQISQPNGPYFGQEPPGKEAELFAPQIITWEVHGSPLISHDLKEIIIGSMEEGTKYFNMSDGIWSLQEALPFDTPRNCNGMFISPSGKKVYFLIWESYDENFYMIEKINGKWSKLHSLGEEVNSFPTHWQFTTAKNENLYFASEGNIVVSVYDGKAHIKPISLKLENLKNLEGGTPFIAPDESYLIFSHGPDMTDTDLYISYRQEDNRWTVPQTLGSSINAEGCLDLCPKISPDGKYLFFISRRIGTDFKVYWVDAGFVEALRPG